MIKTDILIIGAGPTGLFAVFEAGLLKMNCHILDSLTQPGGQLTELYPRKPIYDIPGYPEIIAGDLIENLLEQIKPFSPSYTLGETAQGIEKIDDGSFIVSTDKKTKINASVIAIAGGLGTFTPRKPNISNISDYEENGVLYMIKNPDDFRDKNVLIAGGGDSALDWTIHLSDIAKKVTLVHRRKELRAEKILQSRLINKSNIEILWEKKVEEFLGDGLGVNGLKLSSTKDSSSSEIEVDGVFVAIGHDPSTAIFKDKIKLDKDNYVITDKGGTNTSVPGIFAAGDCVDKIYRQAVTAAGMGCMAALDAEKWLAEKK